MRKATVVLFVVLVLALGGTCFAAVTLYHQRDDVMLTERTAWGKKDVLQDLSMQINLVYQDRLRWSTKVSMKNTEEAVTEFESSLAPIYTDIRRYTGLSMDLFLDTAMVQENILQEKTEGVTKAYAQLAETIGANEEAEAEIYLKDYVEVYPYSIQLYLPGTDIYRNPGWSNETVKQEQERYVIEKINDFFRIPVLEEERHSISIGKNQQGEIYHTGSGNGESDFFYMWTFNALAEDALYITFDTHSRDGVVVDTSLIPGGYGIYRLPYDGSLEGSVENADRISAKVDELEMVYPLDAQIRVKHLQLNGNKDKLLLHAEENGKYVVTVIDISTMEMLQKMEVMDWDKDYGYQIYEKDNFVVVMVHKPQEEGKIEAVVFNENEEGTLENSFISEVQNKNIPSFDTSNLYLAFDGNRLAMAGFLEEEEQDYRETCNVFVAVCDAEGLQYYGEYGNSLETGYDPERYYYHCQGDGLEPIVLEWESD